MSIEPVPDESDMPRPKGSRNNSAKLSDDAHEGLRIAAGFMGMPHSELLSSIVLAVCKQIVAYKHAQWVKGDNSRFDPAAKKFRIAVTFEEDETPGE